MWGQPPKPALSGVEGVVRSRSLMWGQPPSAVHSSAARSPLSAMAKHSPLCVHPLPAPHLRNIDKAMPRPFPAAKDRALIQIVDSALADAAQRSGAWLVCRPGCTQCCIGVFPINQLDAQRLRRGLADLEKTSPRKALRVRSRARDAVTRLSPHFPGDSATGILQKEKEEEEEDYAARFSVFANDEPCPALDPATGNCDLYESRPMTCRVFGPPIRSADGLGEDGLGVCELCYHGASDEEIAACEIKPDPDGLESTLLKQVEDKTGIHGETIAAFCLVR